MSAQSCASARQREVLARIEGERRRLHEIRGYLL
jgi:hypothetical protein